MPNEWMWSRGGETLRTSTPFSSVSTTSETGEQLPATGRQSFTCQGKFRFRADHATQTPDCVTRAMPLLGAPSPRLTSDPSPLRSPVEGHRRLDRGRKGARRADDGAAPDANRALGVPFTQILLPAVEAVPVGGIASGEEGASRRSPFEVETSFLRLPVPRRCFVAQLASRPGSGVNTLNRLESFVSK